MGVIIQERHIKRVKMFKPCFDTEDLIGTDATELKQEYLIWVEDNCPDLANEFLQETGLPLWAGSSDGVGVGDGDGYGDGDGDGYGVGDGVGDGYGYGVGVGYGYGVGYGDGYGVGVGYGYRKLFAGLLGA